MCTLGLARRNYLVHGTARSLNEFGHYTNRFTVAIKCNERPMYMLILVLCQLLIF